MNYEQQRTDVINSEEGILFTPLTGGIINSVDRGYYLLRRPAALCTPLTGGIIYSVDRGHYLLR